MLPKDPLTRKIIDRLDRIDPKVLEQRFTDLSDTCDLYLGVLEEAAEGVLLINRSGALEWLNKAAIDLLGLPVSILKLKSKWLQELPDPALGTLIKSNLAKLTEKKTESISVLNPRERRLRLSFIPTMSKHTTAAILITDQTA
ncbi:MAG: PAS domain-containing protein, partial [Candidatus Omnitrophica bacterium]|nr:PAS domain-containing protein [Candidatus Omnitrophota bacterium]